MCGFNMDFVCLAFNPLLSTISLLFFNYLVVGKGPQTFSTVFARIAGDFGLVAQNPLTENGLLFMILSSSAVPVWDLIKTRIIKLFERKHWLRIYRSVINLAYSVF